MNAALAALLSSSAIWRGGECAPEPAALPTGFAALDSELPGGGWPGNALTEVELAREGIGELRLALPACAQLTRAGRQVVWIEPPYRPYAPALAAAGVVLSKLILVKCRDARETLWAFDQALRAPECGAAFAWLTERDERCLRRLAVAAREGHTWGMLWRRPGVHAQAIAAPLRLALDADQGQLAVRILKRRGGVLANPVCVDLATRWSTASLQALASPPFAPTSRGRSRPALPVVSPGQRNGGHLHDIAEQARARRAGAAN